jgi:ArsR family transcriptional regulator
MPIRKSAIRASSKSRAGIVKAMAHPTRLLVMEALMEGELCVNDLTDLAGCDVTTLSKHLSVMKRAGLLVCEKRGLQVFYQIACPCFAEFFRCVDLIATTRGRLLACAC